VPRPRRSTQSTSLSPGQANYVLERLVADRRISPGEIYRYLSDVNREISSLEERLNSLRGVSGGSYARPSGGGAAAPARRGRRRGRPPGRPRGTGAAAAEPAAAGAKTGRRRGRPPGSGKKAGGGGKRSALTPEQLASRQLQGRYLGLIRQIPANKRGQYQKTAKEKGREAAIKEMQGALGK
jgi:hypothetical protein